MQLIYHHSYSTWSITLFSARRNRTSFLQDTRHSSVWYPYSKQNIKITTPCYHIWSVSLYEHNRNLVKPDVCLLIDSLYYIDSEFNTEWADDSAAIEHSAFNWLILINIFEVQFWWNSIKVMLITAQNTEHTVKRLIFVRWWRHCHH